MKTNKLVIGSLALVYLAVVSACSTPRQVTYQDDMYNNRAANSTEQAYQSPDYYYTDGQETASSNTNNQYYADEYSDQEYYENDYEDMEYANRINRFYYSSPGMSYYDPWFDPWYGNGGFGLGWSNWGWGSRCQWVLAGVVPGMVATTDLEHPLITGMVGEVTLITVTAITGGLTLTIAVGDILITDTDMATHTIRTRATDMLSARQDLLSVPNPEIVSTDA